MKARAPRRAATVAEVMQHLGGLGSEAHKLSLARLGVKVEHALGVSTAEVRKLGRALQPDRSLALGLWETQIHEARLLAVLLLPVSDATPARLERWLGAITSWDLCDHLCINLIVRAPECRGRFGAWARSHHEFTRRAVFSTIAGIMIHDDTVGASEVDGFLQLVRGCIQEESLYVRKAASWALREIGKRPSFAARALAAADELSQSTDPGARWVGRDALSELATLVAVPERGRLLSSRTKMGKNAPERS